MASSTMLAGAPMAFVSGGGGAMSSHVSWAYKDNNDVAFGSGEDMNSICVAFAQMGVTMLPGGGVYA